MTSRALLFVATSLAAAAAGCVDGDLATEPAAREEIRLPDVVVYVPDGEHGRTLVPEDATYIHLAWTPGPNEKSSYVWGIVNNEVRYIYQVYRDDRDDIDREFILSILEREAAGAVRGHSIAGTTGSGLPRPPTPPGEPPFSQAYAAAIVEAGAATKITTLEMLRTISEE